MKKAGLTVLAFIFLSGLAVSLPGGFPGPETCLAKAAGHGNEAHDRDHTVRYLEKKLRSMEQELGQLSQEAEKGLNQATDAQAAAWRETLALWNSKRAAFTGNLDKVKNADMELWQAVEKDLQRDWKELVGLYEKAKTEITGE